MSRPPVVQQRGGEGTQLQRRGGAERPSPGGAGRGGAGLSLCREAQWGPGVASWPLARAARSWMGEEGRQRSREPRSYRSQRPHCPVNHSGSLSLTGLLSGLGGCLRTHVRPQGHVSHDSALRDPTAPKLHFPKSFDEISSVALGREACHWGLCDGPFLLSGPVCPPPVRRGGISCPPYASAVTATRPAGSGRPFCGSCAVPAPPHPCQPSHPRRADGECGLCRR